MAYDSPKRVWAPSQLHQFDEIGSTNDEAKRLALAGAEEFSVVWAHTQTGGRGRRGRVWDSSPGNLHCSILLRPDVSLGQMALFSFLAAVALVDAVYDLAPGLDLRCKWPNDVLCEGRKIAGILLEAGGPTSGCTSWLVLGMGVNVSSAPDPAKVRVPASCLKDHGCDATAGDMLGALYARLNDRVDLWRREGFAPIRAAWLDRAGGIGEGMTVQLERETIVGTFSGIGDDGALLLHLEDGGIRRVMAGDVFFGLVPLKNDQGE